MAGVSSDSSGDSPSPKYGTEKHSATTEEEVEFGGLETLGSRTAAASDDIDPALDARITRKFDLHILPWLFGIWLCAFIDRSNIGNARIQGLSTQLGLDVNNRFNIALTVFYILYILVDVPSNWIMKRVGAGLYLPGLIILWGIVGTCIGLVKTFGGLVALRMLLGLFEGGLFGGMVLYASMFYRRHQLLLRLALWYCAAPLSGAIGGLLAAGLGQIRHGGYNSWPWIFIVEGAATVVFGVLTLFFLPHTPATSRFLTEEEREGAVRRMQIDSHGTNSSSSVDQEKFSWKWVRMAVLNINTILCSLNFLFILVPVYSFSLFLPTIISGLGYTGVIAQLFTVPPNVGGFIMVILVAFVSDRIKSRGWVIIFCSLLAIIGYIMLLAAPTASVRYGGTFFIAAGIFPNAPAVNAWLNNNLAPHYTRATGSGIIVAVGNCAAFLATFTYLTTDAPRYITGHSINLGMLALTIITSVITMLYVKWENSKRERGLRDHRLAEEDGSLLGYRHPSFRYTM